MACSTAFFSAQAQEPKTTKAVISASYVTDLLFNVDGGERRGTGWIGRGDLVAALPGEMIGLEETEFFVDIMALHGDDFSGRLVNDGQVVSNIDAPSMIRPIEAWARVGLSDTRTLKLGIIDLNSEFDTQEVGGHFINSSHGIGPDFSQSGLNGPSIFPYTSFGAILSHAGENFSARVGLFDAMPGDVERPGRLVVRAPVKYGALLVGEAETRLTNGMLVRLGGWHYTKGFERLVPGPERTSQSAGIYSLVESRIGTTHDASLDGWLRVGAAAGGVNPISAYIGGGLTFGDDRSRIGLAVAHARLGGPGRARLALDGIAPERAETAIELTYSGRLREGFQWQPNLQYVVNPGWDRHRPNALVGGVRLSVDIGTR